MLMSNETGVVSGADCVLCGLGAQQCGRTFWKSRFATPFVINA
jgi:succinate dehydrogenase/fumarate reductase-like Fe-S protein